MAAVGTGNERHEVFRFVMKKRGERGYLEERLMLQALPATGNLPEAILFSWKHSWVGLHPVSSFPAGSCLEL